MLSRTAILLVLLLLLAASDEAQPKSAAALGPERVAPRQVSIPRRDFKTFIEQLSTGTKVLLYLEFRRELIGRVRSRRATDFDLSVGRSIVTIPYSSVTYAERRRFWVIRFGRGVGEFCSATWELFGVIVLRKPV